MKKTSILCICALMGLGAAAQQTVVKDAERAMKKGDGYAQVMTIITPAFSDPETAQQAITYYIPGKAGFSQYDQLLGMKSFNKLPENGEQMMAEALLGGYENFMKALPLDSLPDEKGKIKPKYSKEMINTIAGHYHDFNNAAIEFWNLKDFGKAYESWTVFVELPNNPTFEKALTNVPADSIMSEIMYNQALAAWQTDNFQGALDAFINAKDHGYKKKNIFDYSIAVASALDKPELVSQLAREALPLYGNEDPNYIGLIINGYLNNKEYQQALNMIDEAIATNPDNAQYYVIKGILYEQDGIEGDSKSEYAKAVEIDPQNAQALYNYGRMFYNEACIANDNAPTDDAAYSKVYHETIKPTMLKAVDLFERAYDIDNNNLDALKLLQTAYYMLNDEKNLKYTEERLKN